MLKNKNNFKKKIFLNLNRIKIKNVLPKFNNE